MIIITTKSCPNCGANLKFDIDDKITMCDYCGSQILIENRKDNTTQNNHTDQNNIYVNRNWEIFKWILSILHLPLALFIGIFGIVSSNPIFGILIILGGILSIPKISELVFKNKRILKVIIIESLIVIGIIGTACTMYPFKIEGKLVSDQTDMTVEFKGNNIIIEVDGEVIEKNFECEETASIYGFEIYKIEVDDYTFVYRKPTEKGIHNKFYLTDRFGNELYTFYSEDDKDSYDY